MATLLILESEGNMIEQVIIETEESIGNVRKALKAHGIGVSKGAKGK